MLCRTRGVAPTTGCDTISGLPTWNDSRKWDVALGVFKLMMRKIFLVELKEQCTKYKVCMSLLGYHLNRESKSRSSQFSYTDIMNNMNILAVVTPPSIYMIAPLGRRSGRKSAHR